MCSTCGCKGAESFEAENLKCDLCGTTDLKRIENDKGQVFYYCEKKDSPYGKCLTKGYYGTSAEGMWLMPNGMHYLGVVKDIDDPATVYLSNACPQCDQSFNVSDAKTWKHCDNCYGDYDAESFEAETSTKEMNKAYKQYKINLEKYVGFGDLWEKIHDESLRLQSQGLIAFDAWNKACKKFKVYDKLTKGVNMEHLREREKRYEPDSYYGGAESFGAESNFDKLANKIAAQYRKKGKSAKEAMRIGKATAAKIGFKKYGKAGMRRKAMRGRMAKGAEGSMPKKSIIPNVIIFGVLGVTAYLATKIKSVEFGADGDCGCGCKGAKVGGCGDTKQADEGHYPETFDPVQDWLPRYRYPADSDWSNSYNPADPYRPLDYQTVQVDSRTTVDKMGMI